LRERAAMAFNFPVGLANPLWLTYGAAAGVGAAWWLASRWAAPVNLERLWGFAAPAKAEPEPAVELAAPSPVETASEILAEPVIAPAAPAGIPAETPPAPAPAPDDLTRLVGVGPRTAAALAARGVTRFIDLAAWTEAEMAAFDAEMKLMGRSRRDAWRAQARRLAAES
jgi:predicted flap endonuclease-1-like 5' DNA nuclease